MPVAVKGKISFNPGAKGGDYNLSCDQLGIDLEGSGDIEQDIEALREKITEKIAEEFKVEPSAVQIESYTLSLNFDIEGPVNRTLSSFTKDDTDEDTAKSAE